MLLILPPNVARSTTDVTQVAIPSTITNILSWGWLAYHSKKNDERAKQSDTDIFQLAQDSFVQKLFVTALVTTGSGTLFAWTALRHVNGALSIRTERLVGHQKHVALLYSVNEVASIRAEEKYTTEQLVQKWANFNMFRAVVLLIGTVIGAYGLAIEASLR
jgi:hypothetical protein